MTKISIFNAPVTNTKPHAGLETKTIIAYIKTNYKKQTEHLRSLKNIKEIRSYKARAFDYVTWAGTFNERTDKGLQTYSGYLVIDIDHIEHDISALRATIAGDEHTYILFTSPSGLGLKIIFRLDNDKPKNHVKFFYDIERYFLDKYSLKIDKSGKDLSRACFLPYDPDIFVNDNSKKWELRKEKIEPPKPEPVEKKGEYTSVVGLTELKKMNISDKVKDLIINHMGSQFAKEYGMDRSRIDEAITESLIRAGYDDNTVYEIFFNKKFKCGDKVAEKGWRNGQKYVDHNIKTAREHITDTWNNMPAIDKINSIRRRSKMNQAEKINEMRKVIIEDLKHYGVFVYDERIKTAYFFNREKKELEDFSDERRLRGFLAYKYKVLNLEIHSIAAGMSRMIEEEGIKAKISKFVKFDKDRVFLSTFDGRYYEIDKDGWEQKTIGLDKILFKPNADFQRVVPEITGQEIRYFKKGLDFDLFKESLLYEYVFGKVNFKDDPILTNEDRMKILLTWFYQMFFRDIAPTRPIILMYGDKGSGKSFFGRTIGRILFSDEFNVLPLPKDIENFRVVANSEMFFVLDNVDKYHGWVQDELAVVSTGGVSKSRELYTSKGISSLRPDSFVVVTSRNPSTLRRDDLAERTFKIEVKELGNHISEYKFYENLKKQRGKIWGEIIVNICDILKLYDARESEPVYNFRMAEFAGFVDLLFNDGIETKNILRKLRGSSEEFSIHGSRELEAIMGYFDDGGEGFVDCYMGDIVEKIFDETYLRKYGKRSIQTRFAVWLTKNENALKEYIDVQLFKTERKTKYTILSKELPDSEMEDEVRNESDPF